MEVVVCQLSSSEMLSKFSPMPDYSAYGMTEACSSITFMNIYDPTKGDHSQQPSNVKKSTSSIPGGIYVGKPAPHVELRISAEESSSDGRILMRGPRAMLHYWGQTVEHLDPEILDGWLMMTISDSLDGLIIKSRPEERTSIQRREDRGCPVSASWNFQHCCHWSSRSSFNRDGHRLYSTESKLAMDNNYEPNHSPGKEVQSLSGESLRQFYIKFPRDMLCGRIHISIDNNWENKERSSQSTSYISITDLVQ